MHVIFFDDYLYEIWRLLFNLYKLLWLSYYPNNIAIINQWMYFPIVFVLWWDVVLYEYIQKQCNSIKQMLYVIRIDLLIMFIYDNSLTFCFSCCSNFEKRIGERVCCTKSSQIKDGGSIFFWQPLLASQSLKFKLNAVR